MSTDRRRFRRVQVRGLLRGKVVTTATSMDVQDLSFGGFAAETATPFHHGRLYDFEFTAPTGPPIVVSARVAYCQRVSEADSPPRYHSGFEFIHPHEESRLAVGELIAHVAPSLHAP
jgi:hypothetical protein